MLLTKLKCEKWFEEMERDGINFEKFMQIQKEKVMEYTGIKGSVSEKAVEKVGDTTADTSRIMEDNAGNNEKLIKLENDLEDLYGKYYDIISMQSTWKAECQLY